MFNTISNIPSNLCLNKLWAAGVRLFMLSELLLRPSGEAQMLLSSLSAEVVATAATDDPGTKSYLWSVEFASEASCQELRPTDAF